MTISSSLNAGVAGLNSNATRLATISDNIANSATNGYKRAGADFSSMVIDSGDTRYSAGGVRVKTVRYIDETGSLAATSNPTDIAVRGRGFIPVTSETALISSTDDFPLYMTTTGSFRTDENGVLKTPTGQVLLGWPAAPDGTIPTYPRDTVAALEPVQIQSNQFATEPTTAITLGVNLPATETEPTATSDPLSLSVEYFDNLGTSQAINVTYTADRSMPAASNAWTMRLTDGASAGALIAEFDVVFDDTRGSGGNLLSVTPTASHPASAGTWDPATGIFSVVVAGGPIEINIGTPTNGVMTQLSDSFAPTSITKNGFPAGNLTSVEIDGNGFLSANFDTGISRILYQIPVLDVPNPNGLDVLDNQTYAISSTSGSFFLWDAGDGPTGDLVGYALEESATDVAGELTELIKTQRAYSSNAKVIQTVDEMLQETTNIKR